MVSTEIAKILIPFCVFPFSVADKLPKPNLILLQHLMCVLHHISNASDINKMDSRNLAVCIAPNMLVSQVDQETLALETQKELNKKVKHFSMPFF